MFTRTYEFAGQVSVYFCPYSVSDMKGNIFNMIKVKKGGGGDDDTLQSTCITLLLGTT